MQYKKYKNTCFLSIFVLLLKTDIKNNNKDNIKSTVLQRVKPINGAESFISNILFIITLLCF